MKAFVWKRLDNLTSCWHPEGGLLIIAEDLEAAINGFAENGGLFDLSTFPPDFVFEAPGHTGIQIVDFPDAGCC